MKYTNVYTNLNFLTNHQISAVKKHAEHHGYVVISFILLCYLIYMLITHLTNKQFVHE